MQRIHFAAWNDGSLTLFDFKMEPIIRVENLGKQYVIGTRDTTFDTLREALANTIRSPLKLLGRNGHSPARTIWALRDISFEVNPGEVVGIIGRNGAGKSTLLKILSRVTDPTTGRAELNGRVGSLLEVGTGFHVELSGRENIYLNGAILGMRRAEIDRKFDEIVAFAEVEEFIDTPVKRYSSGMYLRLAFAVAAHLEPKILIVDEVLAVGDIAFQKKCLGKVGDVAREGRTVLFVSHNMIALQSLCPRAIWLDKGLMIDDGEVNHVVNRYLHTTVTAALVKEWNDPNLAPGNAEARLRAVRVIPENQDPVGKITVQTSLRVEFEFWNYVPDVLLNFSLVLYNLEGICVLNARSAPQKCPSGLIRQTCLIPGNFLNDETYMVSLVIIRDTCFAVLDALNVLMFDVHDVEREGAWYGKWIGVVRPNFEWSTELISE